MGESPVGEGSPPNTYRLYWFIYKGRSRHQPCVEMVQMVPMDDRFETLESNTLCPRIVPVLNRGLHRRSPQSMAVLSEFCVVCEREN
jgi:hypothetical protein